MAYALVAAGAAVQGSSGAAVTPAYGATPGAGHLLLLVVLSGGSSTRCTLPTGWSNLGGAVNTKTTANLYGKIAAGGDAAPTASAVASTVQTCKLYEFSGNPATIGAVSDENVSFNPTTFSSPTTGTASGADVSSGELVIYGMSANYSVAGAKTNSLALNNATLTDVNNNATSTVNHYNIGYGITTSNGSADALTATYDTTNPNSQSVAALSFKTAVVAHTATASDTSVSTDVTSRGAFAGVRAAPDTSVSTDLAGSTSISAATAADTSSSASTSASGQIATVRMVADTSVSTDTVMRIGSGARTASDTSTSTDNTLSSGPNTTKDITLSTEVAWAGLIGITRTASDESDSLDSTFGSQAGSASDSSSSADSVASITTSTGTASDVSLTSDVAVFLVINITVNVADVSFSTDTLNIRSYRRASDTSVSSDVVFVREQAVGYSIRVRERMPLRLSVNVATPDGHYSRWGADDPNPRHVPGSLTFSTVMPGGFEAGSCVLQRDPAKDDVVPELSRVTVRGIGGLLASQGRLEGLPDASGDSSTESPAWVGYQSELTDNNSAREIFVDQNIGSWIGPSIQRQLQWLQQATAVMATGPSVGPDYGNNAIPALVCDMTGSWVQAQVVEAWYDARGISLGRLFAAWRTNGNFTLTGGTAFGAAMFLATDGTGTSYDQINPITTSPSSATLSASTSARQWALLQFWEDNAPYGQENTLYDLYFTSLGVYGNHGLQLYPAAGAAQGVKAADAIAYMINKWTDIDYTTGVNGTIQPSVFVIPQLVFLDPTTVAEMIKQATAYELLDWGVWDGPDGDPTFYLNPRGARGNKWRVRTGPGQLQQSGPQISRLWNGVVVQYTDVTGVTRTVGPPGALTNTTDASLLDSDPLNPVNEAGIKRWALVTMGTSTLAAATQIGQRFLQEQKVLNISGQATLTGYVQDAYGIFWPSWRVRAGDQISFTDAADTRYRRIVHTSYDDSSKANSIQLDQPPDSLAALLARLSILITPYGMS